MGGWDSKATLHVELPLWPFLETIICHRYYYNVRLSNLLKATEVIGGGTRSQTQAHNPYTRLPFMAPALNLHIELQTSAYLPLSSRRWWAPWGLCLISLYIFPSVWCKSCHTVVTQCMFAELVREPYSHSSSVPPSYNGVLFWDDMFSRLSG